MAEEKRRASKKEPTAVRPDVSDLFQPVKARRLSSQIADELRQAIASGRLNPGDRLPSERELVARYQVSRNSIREAARILEMAGLVTIRQGATGGVFVTKPDLEAMNRSAWFALKASDLDVRELYEVRRVIEPAVAEMAAERADPEELKALHEMLDAPQSVSASSADRTSAAHGFHFGIARLTKNKTLMMIVGSLMELADRAEEEIRPKRALAYDAHVKILAAVEQKNAALARELTLAHLDAQEAEVQAGLTGKVAEPSTNGTKRRKR
jgi:DNA-binding FadR family transcriptional regulator